MSLFDYSSVFDLFCNPAQWRSENECRRFWLCSRADRTVRSIGITIAVAYGFPISSEAGARTMIAMSVVKTASIVCMM
jgi:hypothetical protein